MWLVDQVLESGVGVLNEEYTMAWFQGDDLMAALESGELAGAGLDVTDPEPLPTDHPLWRLPNVIITPHVAASSVQAVERLQAVVRENLRRYVAGEPMLSVVDVGRGY